MSKFYNLEPPDPNLEFWGNSDLLAQIADELRNHPDTCFSRNVIAWYTSAYAPLIDELTDCSYQIDINQSLCPVPQPPSSLEDVIKILLDYSQGKNRRIALSALRIIFRETTRLITEQKAGQI
jgi:hypothetical protein